MTESLIVPDEASGRPARGITKLLRLCSLQTCQGARFRPAFRSEGSPFRDGRTGIFFSTFSSSRNTEPGQPTTPDLFHGLHVRLLVQASRSFTRELTGRLRHIGRYDRERKFQVLPDVPEEAALIQFLGLECASNIVWMDLYLPGEPAPYRFRNPLGPEPEKTKKKRRRIVRR